MKELIHIKIYPDWDPNNPETTFSYICTPQDITYNNGKSKLPAGNEYWEEKFEHIPGYKHNTVEAVLLRLLAQRSQDVFAPLFEDHRKRRIHGHVLMHFGPANKLLLVRKGEDGHDRIDYYLSLENPHSPGTIEPDRDMYELANSVHKIDDPKWTPSFCIKATRTLQFPTISRDLQVRDFFDYAWPPSPKKRAPRETSKENPKENGSTKKKHKTAGQAAEAKNGGKSRDNKYDDQKDEKKMSENETSDDDDDEEEDYDEKKGGKSQEPPKAKAGQNVVIQKIAGIGDSSSTSSEDSSSSSSSSS